MPSLIPIALAAFLGVEAPGSTARPAVIVAFGDSITRGVHMPLALTYPHMLGELLPDARVENRGVPGNTIAQGTERLDRDVLSLRPQFVVVSFGVNDSVMTAADKARVPRERYGKLLAEMIDRIRAAGAEPIVATQTPIIAAPYYKRHPKAYYGAAGGVCKFLSTYNEVIRRVAKAKRVPMVDIAKLFKGREEQWLRPAPDGVNPNPQGYEAMAGAFADALRGQPGLKGTRQGRIGLKPIAADEFDTLTDWRPASGIEARCEQGLLRVRAGKTVGSIRRTFYLDLSRLNTLSVKVDRATGVYNIQVWARAQRHVFRRASDAGSFRASHGFKAKGCVSVTVVIYLAANAEADFDYLRFEE